MITPTPKQQKAQFSAFDTTSNFRSGLRDVGQALTSLGRSAQTYGDVVKRRKEKAQTIVADKAYQAWTDKINGVFAEHQSALNSGNNDLINSSLAAVQDLQKSSIVSHIPQNTMGELDNEEIISNYNNRLRLSMSRRLADAVARRDEVVVLNNASDQQDAFDADVASFNLENAGVAASPEQMQELSSHPHIAGSENFGLENEEVLDTAYTGIRDQLVKTFVANIGLTVSEEDRKEQLEVYKELVRSSPHLKWTSENSLDVQDVFLKARSDKQATIDISEKTVNDWYDKSNLLIGASFPNPGLVEEAYVKGVKHVTDLAAFVKPDNATLEQGIATLNALSLFIPNEDGRTSMQYMKSLMISDDVINSDQAIVEYLTLAEKPSQKSKDLGEGKTEIYLNPSTLSKIRNHLDFTKTEIERSVDAGSSDFLRLVVPGFRQQLANSVDAEGRMIPDKRVALEQSYYNWRRENPTVYGKPSPSVFYIPPVTKFPATLTAASLKTRFSDEIKNNSVAAINYAASSALINADVTVNEAAYAFLINGVTSNIVGSDMTNEQVQGYVAGHDLFDILNRSEMATAAQIEITDELIQEGDFHMAAGYKAMAAGGIKNVAEGYKKFILGLVVHSEETDPAEVKKHIQNLEREELAQAFGYVGVTDSSGTVAVPSALLDQVDFTMLGMGSEGLYGFMRIVPDSLKGQFNKKVHPQVMTDVYAAVVGVTAALKYKGELDTVSQLNEVIKEYGPPGDAQTSGFGFNDGPYGFGYLVEEAEKEKPAPLTAEQLFRKADVPFAKALSKGILNNSTEVGVRQVPRFSIQLPSLERHNGELERRIYLTPNNKYGGFSKLAVGKNNNKLVHVDATRVIQLVQEVIKRDTKDITQSSPGMSLPGLIPTNQNRYINTVLSIISEELGYGPYMQMQSLSEITDELIQEGVE